MELALGKRYRVTFVGTASTAQTILLDTGAIVYKDASGMTVELLPDPLPTTPGSVIRVYTWQDVLLAMRHSEGWIDEAGDELIHNRIEQGRWELLFDAGVDRT